MNEHDRRGAPNADHAAVQLAREFDFPRETVFRMFTDPKKAATWFGSPEGAVKVVFEMDARPGGALTLHDRDPQGNIHRTTGTFVEVVAPERLSFTSATAPAGGAAPWEALQSVTFEALGPKKTRVTVQVKVLAPGSFPGGAGELAQGYVGGWGETLDTLQRQLAKRAPAG